AWSTGAGPGPGARLSVVYARTRTARLERAVARYLATRPDADADADSAARAAKLDDGARAVTLEVDCAAPGARWPALDDDESYALEISPRGVRISATAEWGVLRGLATLTQLTEPDGGLPAVRVQDAPRFSWRGLTLDVARHFVPLPDLLHTLDGMALCRMNVLHLHLTDDQGFRFPSVAFPRLASTEAYSRDALATLVDAAADRGIRVVPELDMPGHVSSWLTAYPEWGAGPATPSRRFGVHEACLDPTLPAVQNAVAQLLAELAEVFPDAYLHIGGDEVHPAWWSRSTSIRAAMTALGLERVSDLQAHFNAQLATCVAALGRRLLAWDEVLHPALPPGVTVQSWRGATARDRAQDAGYDCVVSAHYYLDLFFPADVHYGFDPAAPTPELIALEDALGDDPRLAHIAAGMRWTHQWREASALPAGAAGRGRLLGGSACLWAELVDAEALDTRLWSRLPAVAERFWSAPDVADVRDMRQRLRQVQALLPRVGIDLEARLRAALHRAGVSASWTPLIEMLEPVKWYARLLGADALAARLAGREMPLSRPYTADTPLNRVVDALPPEAIGAHDLADTCAAVSAGDTHARARLEALARAWQALPPAGAGPAELAPLAERLIALGLVLGAVLDGALDPTVASARLDDLDAPIGEYLLAPVAVLRAWLDR
ncbi:MAG: beta-N-acetylhexosaminidase, partial [Gammaproteobacteria bacterium]